MDLTRMSLEMGVAATVMTLVLTPLSRDLFRRLGLVDAPDGKRKLHTRSVPRIGGLPIAFAYFTSFLMILITADPPTESLSSSLRLVAGLTVGAGIVFLAGLFDDIWGLRPWQKIAAQVTAGILVYAQGIRVSTIAGFEIETWLSVPLTLAWLVACSNAFNLVDGLDGLAAGMGLVATLTMFLAGVLSGNQELVVVTLPLAGAIAGFLRYNFNPASVFLGDSGSLLIGFLLGCYGAVWTQKSATMVGLTAPFMVMAIPLLDAGVAIARRWLVRRPIFSGDRNHIHHKLLERGLNHRNAVLVLYAVACVGASLSLVHSMAPARFAALFIIAFGFLAWTGIRRLGYAEFVSLGRSLQHRSFRRSVQGELVLHSLEKGLWAARSVDDCWEAVVAGCSQLKFARIEATLQGRRFDCTLAAASTDACWKSQIQLMGAGSISVWRTLDMAGHEPDIAALMRTFRLNLLPKLALLEADAAKDAEGTTRSLIELAARVEGLTSPRQDRVAQ